MKIVIPMAGRGERFLSRGIYTPKPLIDILGRPMMEWALKSVENLPHTETIFIVLREHERDYSVSGTIRRLAGKARIIMLEEPTQGQLCTVLAAKRYIDTDEDILIHNIDTFLISDIASDVKNKSEDTAGIISVIEAPGERWSFAKTDDDGRVIEVAEKARISDNVSTGMYYFSSGKEFVTEAEELIKNRETARGEYYVILVYKKYIEKGKKIVISRARQMYDLGNVESLEAFKKTYRGRFTLPQHI